MNLKGKVALITGASRGVGQAVALTLARHGCAVAVNHRDSRSEAERTAHLVRESGGASCCLQGDASDDADCRRIVEDTHRTFGRLDLLINNAATTQFVPHHELDRISTELWDRIFAVNVRGPFQCVRAARAALEASGDGQVVNIASIAGLTGNGSSIPYCASKAALINLTLALARALAPKIRVNAVAPGFIETQWTKEGLGANYDATVTAQMERSALGAVCQPQDVADAVLSLIGGSKLVTGQTLVCDGGALLGAKR